jgi:phage gp29-like protein
VLLGISTYTRTDDRRGWHRTLDDIDERRDEYYGGLLPPPSVTPTRWYQSDLEQAERMADAGDLRRAGQLMLAARKDGHLAGVLSTRTGGLVRLPRQFRGDAEVVAMLERGHNTTRSAFDEMFPPSELAMFAADGVLLGVAVGELIPVRNRAYPVFVRYDPQYLRFDWSTNTWLYLSHLGPIKITPGDGRWILHTPGGRIAPWQAGLWRAVGQAWIRKQHAALYKDNWEAKLANPARVAIAPQGASEPQKQSHFQRVMAWGVNTVFGMTPGYDVKLIESNGIGWECFVRTIDGCNTEFVLALAGQVVTTTGGTGFANADVHKSIRADLIKETADGLCHTLNTQGLPYFVACVFGPAAVTQRLVSVEYDVTPPKDLNAGAAAMVTVSNAVTSLTTALAPSELTPNVRQLIDQFGIPVLPKPADDPAAVGGGTGDAQDSALNGAQVTSLLQVVTACAGGQLPRDSAVAIIERAFLVPREVADRLLGTIGAGFVPASTGPAPAAPAPPAPATPPAPTEAIAA